MSMVTCRPAQEDNTLNDVILDIKDIEVEAGNVGEKQITIVNKVDLTLRKGEVIGAEWSEIDFDEQIWTIPPEKAKNGLAHRVPLSQIALELLKQINSVAGDSRWLFPSPHGDKPITGPAVDHAMRNNKEYLELENVTPHDLRRTAASYMTSMGINRLTVSKILNHAESGVTAVYDRHSYDNEKREALEAWGLRLSKLIVGKQESEGIQQGDPDTR